MLVWTSTFTYFVSLNYLTITFWVTTPLADLTDKKYKPAFTLATLNCTLLKPAPTDWVATNLPDKSTNSTLEAETASTSTVNTSEAGLGYTLKDLATTLIVDTAGDSEPIKTFSIVKIAFEVADLYPIDCTLFLPAKLPHLVASKAAKSTT